MEPGDTQNHKKQEKRALKKTPKNNPVKNGFQNGSRNGLDFRAETDPKITTIPKILKNDKKSQKRLQNDQK